MSSMMIVPLDRLIAATADPIGSSFLDRFLLSPTKVAVLSDLLISLKPSSIAAMLVSVKPFVIKLPLPLVVSFMSKEKTSLESLKLIVLVALHILILANYLFCLSLRLSFSKEACSALREAAPLTGLNDSDPSF